ncbi:DUF7261 family protein [Halorubrum sp. HHNYT27]|uniref:DUF7261 family protein n=1 Tax=Halorubrum sp. HHNYT27 TaxID=3402275 RepID=UPI003EBD2E81
MAAVTTDPPDGDGSRGVGPRDGGAASDGRGFRDADRGQMLLVAGLIVAVALVALVVLLNASIYSENVATRGIEATDGEAMEVRATAVEGTGALIDGTNRNRPADHGAAITAVEDGVVDLDAYLARAYADRGGVTHLTTTAASMERGSYVTGNLTANGTGGSNASLAAGVDRTRGFVVGVEPTSLASTDESGAVANAFRIEFADSTAATREVYVYENADSNVTVAVGENGSAPTVVCSTPSSGPVDVDLTGSTLGDEGCPGLWTESAGELDGSYDVRIERTDAAAGDVQLTALPESGDAVSSDHTASPAVYEAVIDLSYRTAELRFETTVRVAPGEPDA